MAQMKVDDIRAMSPDQMEDAVLNLKKERFNLRFQRATGQLENTIIVVTSDHGEMLGDAALWEKSVPHQGSIGVPLIVAKPFSSTRLHRRDRRQLRQPLALGAPDWRMRTFPSPFA